MPCTEVLSRGAEHRDDKLSLNSHESIVMYILVFHKKHKNADHMKLNGDQFSASELERHRGSKFVWV